jgi:nitroreductase
LVTASTIAAVDAVIAGRRTVKVFAEPSAPPEIPADFLSRLEPAIAVAGMAPFHYACHASHRGGAGSSEGSGAAIEPWRVHVLDHLACRALIVRIETEAEQAVAAGGGEAEAIWRDAPSSKIPRMLAAAGTLVLLCWLPDPPAPDGDGRREAEREKRNSEHLAATSAYAQNLLLAATARGLASYWSSGGVLATEKALAICGVPAGQALLGALFFFPEPGPSEDFVTGKLRGQRGGAEAWARRVEAEAIADA